MTKVEKTGEIIEDDYKIEITIPVLRPCEESLATEHSRRKWGWIFGYFNEFLDDKDASKCRRNVEGSVPFCVGESLADSHREIPQRHIRLITK